jgi:hypothetical protein
MRPLVDADFNAASREISLRLDIYLDEIPLEVTKQNYLIDASWLEEGSADSSNPFGAVSSNELSFRLYNDSGIFSPTDTSSPYFGKIRNGIKVILYIKVEGTEWTQLGEYFVTDWEAAITGTYADVIANDKWYQIFSSASPNYPVTLDIPFNEMIYEVYNSMGYTVQVSNELTELLPVAFIEGSPLDFTQEILAGALAFCTCTKLGMPLVLPFISARPIRAALTDMDQIKVVNAKQSTTKTYEGVELTYVIPSYTEVSKLVELANIEVAPGTSNILNIASSSTPVLKHTSVDIQSILEKVSLVTYTASSQLLSFELFNPSQVSVAATLTVYGIPVTFTDVVIADNSSTLLKVKSRYTQTVEYAIRYRELLENVVNSPVPFLTLSIRGNPLLSIGDRVQINSDKYNLFFDGVIQRMSYNYDGGLSCEMTLMNSAILEEVV